MSNTTAAEFVQKERSFLEIKIAALLQKEAGYEAILDLTSLPPGLYDPVITELRQIGDIHVQREIAGQIVLRDTFLEGHLLEYLSGLRKIWGIQKEPGLPNYAITALKEGLLEDVINQREKGTLALKVFPDELQLGLKLTSSLPFIYARNDSPQNNEEFGTEVRKIGELRNYYGPLANNPGIMAVIQKIGVLSERDWFEGKLATNTFISILEGLKETPETGRAYAKMLENILGNTPHFSSESIGVAKSYLQKYVAFLEVLQMNTKTLPADLQESFYQTVAKYTTNLMPYRRGGEHVDESICLHLFTTLSLAMQLQRWNGGIKDEESKQKAILSLQQTYNILDFYKKNDVTIPAQFYRKRMQLSEEGGRTYSHLLIKGLMADQDFAIASVGILGDYVRAFGQKAAEDFYATALDARTINWHYGEGVLQQGAEDVKKRETALSESSTVSDPLEEILQKARTYELPHDLLEEPLQKYSELRKVGKVLDIVEDFGYLDRGYHFVEWAIGRKTSFQDEFKRELIKTIRDLEMVYPDYKFSHLSMIMGYS